MKNLYSKGCLDVTKINSGEWYKDFMAKNKKYRDQFEDDDLHTSNKMFVALNPDQNKLILDTTRDTLS